MDDAIKTAIATGCGTWLLFNLLFNFHTGGHKGNWFWASPDGFSINRLMLGALVGGVAAGIAYFVSNKK